MRWLYDEIEWFNSCTRWLCLEWVSLLAVSKYWLIRSTFWTYIGYLILCPFVLLTYLVHFLRIYFRLTRKPPVMNTWFAKPLLLYLDGKLFKELYPQFDRIYVKARNMLWKRS